MSTVSALIDITLRQHLEMSGPSDLNRLQTTVNDTIEDVVLDWMPEAAVWPGAYIECGAETMLVVSSQDVNLTVLRGQQGSTAAAHTAGDLIRVQPRFLRSQVLTEMQSEIRSWPDTLFGVTRVDIAWPTGSYDVDLSGASGKQITRLLEVRLQPSANEPWFDLASSVEVYPASVTDFASGWRLHSLRDFSLGTVEVAYASTFVTTTLTEATDLQATVGLSEGMEDIIRYGTAARLLLSQEGERARLDVQGQTRFPEEVPPQHPQTAAKGLAELRDLRMQQEEERLISRWGVS